MSGNDALGARMKDSYEHRARTMLPRRTHTIVRLDGRAFHSYTRGLNRPYDGGFMADMWLTAEALAAEVAGCRLAYVQSDEISLLLTDFATPHTEAWFGGNQQKIVSLSAAIATHRFNELRPGKRALFDSRAFTIPDPIEVANYFIWRQQDATRNSISMAAQAHFSHADLHKVNSAEMQEKLWSERGVNWNDYDPRFKRGTVVAPTVRRDRVSYVDKRTGQMCTTDEVERRTWSTWHAPIFTRRRDWIAGLIAGEQYEHIPDDDTPDGEGP